MNVILSIKPCYVEKIIKRIKRYEFRKAFLRKNYSNTKVYIYSSSPVQRIIGYFTIKNILEDHPEKLWAQCKNSSGIAESAFFDYFQDRDRGYAIQISALRLFDDPIDPKQVIQNFVAPQSYRFISDIFPNCCPIN